MDDRYRLLGKAIWGRVVNIEAYHVAQRFGSPVLSAEMPERIDAEERALWGDLQTLFRGGVFTEDLWPSSEERQPYWQVAGAHTRHLIDNVYRNTTLCGRNLEDASVSNGSIPKDLLCGTCKLAAESGKEFWRSA